MTSESFCRKSDFKKIIAWREAHKLVTKIYQVTKDFPTAEKFCLTSQMRRASYSVPANIAEGRSRKTTREYIWFLKVAQGSLAEVEYFLLLARDLGYCQGKIYNELDDQRKRTDYLLYRLIQHTR